MKAKFELVSEGTINGTAVSIEGTRIRGVRSVLFRMSEEEEDVSLTVEIGNYCPVIVNPPLDPPIYPADK